LATLVTYNDEIASFRQPVLIYNPAAGVSRRNPELILQRTIAALARVDLSPRLLPTSAPGEGRLTCSGSLYAKEPIWCWFWAAMAR
jgi:hypothetical protein